jgi:hypothetical protein
MNARLLGLTVMIVVLGWLPRPSLGRAEPAPESEDVLGEIVVEATRDEAGRIRLPPLVVRPSDGTRPEVIGLHAVVARDLELAGIFEVDASLDELRADDVRPRVIVDVQDDGVQPPRMVARVQRRRDGEWTASEVVVSTTAARDRPASHRLADRVLGELTGRDGAFAGRLAVVRRTEGSDPRLYHADPDGRGLKVITPASQLVVATAFDPQGRLYYAASIQSGAIGLYRQGDLDPQPVEPRGSIYGVSFGPKGRIALSIARGPRIEVWAGTDLGALARVREGSLDMHPVLAPDGRVAFAGEARGTTRIYVGGKAVTPSRASSPAWCDHPDGLRLVWIERSSKSSWIWSRRLGQPARKLLGVRGKLSAATCSPDGRVLLFSYDGGRALDGPGVYMGNVDVLRPRKILPGPARALAWAAPEPARQ